ncbi:MAG: hypothetical protein E7387_02100 [Ruminococcaceae bacterium]|nr:hypothetical protein [Oscillospiraceae bacterium]
METILKIALAGVVVSMLIVLLKGMQSQMVPLITAAGSVLLLVGVLNTASGAIESIRKLFDNSQLSSETVKCVVKIIGAAYTVEFSSALCRDFGENSTAAKIEAAGRVFIVMMAVPWAATLIETVKSLAG